MVRNNASRPTVVIPGFSLTSLGAARCLANSRVNIVSIGSRDICYEEPFYLSNIPEKKIVIPPEQSIVQALLDIRGDFNDSPVLLLANDKDVLEVSEDRSLIDQHYKFLLPPKDVIRLVDKNRFAEIARESGFKVPKTVTISGPEEMGEIVRELAFPFLLKPHLLHSRRISDEVELESYLRTWSPTNWHSVVAQEWIPGDDSSIYCCHVYFSRDGEPIACLTLQKIRQWPPQYGTMSLCRTVDNSHVLMETIRIFEILGLRGYGQMEYKYHQGEDVYYITEPTIGRFTQQIAICEAAGVNMPLIAVEYLEEAKIPQCTQRDNVWLIHELEDYLSKRHGLQPNGGGYWRRLLTADAHVLWSRKDPLPLLGTLAWNIKEVAKNPMWLAKTIIRGYTGPPWERTPGANEAQGSSEVGEGAEIDS